jgi:membrane protein insertase Oxa1/YidC/SpoIIIJ
MQKTLDKIGIGLSSLCLIHCLIFPVLLIFFPIINVTNFIDEKYFHLILVTLVIPTALISLLIGCLKHRNFWVMLPAAFGLGFLLTGILVHDIEKIATVIGGVLLAFSHWKNYKLCHLDCHEVK